MFGHRREIDGLRALAVLPVIAFHAGLETFSGGFVGVDVFFVISGYLITSIILTQKAAGTFSLLDFYERRARRILPALFLVMTICIPLSWLYLWGLPSDMKDFSQSLIAVSIFASNILFWRESGYFDTAAELKPLLHTWSLAVEEQYYVLFPLFMLLMWRFAKQWTVAVLSVGAVSSFSLAQWYGYNKPGATFFLLPTRGWEIAIGALVAFYFARYPQRQLSRLAQELGSLIGLSLIVYAVFVYSETNPFPSAYTLAPTLGTALIILCTTPTTLVGRFLSTKVFVGLGLISYSAYLWHYPLFAFTRHSRLDPLSGQTILTLCSLTLFFAYLSWRFVEIPIREGRYTRQALFVAAFVITLFFISYGTFGHIKNGFVDYFDDPFIKQIETVKSDRELQTENARLISANRSVIGALRFGDLQKKPSFVVVGDSHAESLIYAASLIALERQTAGESFSYDNCPPIEISMYIKQNETQKICNSLRRSFFHSLGSQLVPNVIVLASRWTLRMEQTPFDNLEGGIERVERSQWLNMHSEKIGYKAALAKDYKDSVVKMLEKGHQVVLIYPIPEMGWDVPTRVAKLYRSNSKVEASDASISYEVFNNRNKDTYEALDAIGKHRNLFRVYPEKIFCNTTVKDRCVAHINGELLYYDDDHITKYGARLIFEKVKNVLGW